MIEPQLCFCMAVNVRREAHQCAVLVNAQSIACLQYLLHHEGCHGPILPLIHNLEETIIERLLHDGNAFSVGFFQPQLQSCVIATLYRLPQQRCISLGTHLHRVLHTFIHLLARFHANLLRLVEPACSSVCALAVGRELYQLSHCAWLGHGPGLRHLRKPALCGRQVAGVCRGLDKEVEHLTIWLDAASHHLSVPTLSRLQIPDLCGCLKQRCKELFIRLETTLESAAVPSSRRSQVACAGAGDAELLELPGGGLAQLVREPVLDRVPPPPIGRVHVVHLDARVEQLPVGHLIWFQSSGGRAAEPALCRGDI
mmetsp:Transcript_3067/g.11893  ORF Transcript_3067/g.11893 Transcript_3067/m.11893 type:complete len:312 (+) Transcript_3067:1219-2154(+)